MTIKESRTSREITKLIGSKKNLTNEEEIEGEISKAIIAISVSSRTRIRDRFSIVITGKKNFFPCRKSKINQQSVGRSEMY